MSSEQFTDKRQLRERQLSRRRAMSPDQLRHAGAELRIHLEELLNQHRPRVMAAYVPFGSEPMALESSPLPELLRSGGVSEVLLPVWNRDDSLGWAPYRGVTGLAPTRGKMIEPTGPPRPATELQRADLVLVPALAVDRSGQRLGRGRGCYDRALAHARGPVVAVVYDPELVPTLTGEPHDVAVDIAMAPSGIHKMQ